MTKKFFVFYTFLLLLMFQYETPKTTDRELKNISTLNSFPFSYVLQLCLLMFFQILRTMEQGCVLLIVLHMHCEPYFGTSNGSWLLLSSLR